MFARQGLRASSLLGAAAVSAGAAFTGISFYNTSPSIIRSAYADAPPGPKKVFPASGFVELQLHSSEMVNHNVKKLKFKLPEEDAVTGLDPICKPRPSLIWQRSD
jgi:cytochrome-b5 reductase